MLLAYTRSQSAVALATATSGIASLLLDDGRTVHYRFKVPIKEDLGPDDTCPVTKRKNATAELIRRAKLIIIDEASMQNRYIAEIVMRLCRFIKDTDMLNAGITFVFAGDFRQILPVIRRASRAHTLSITLKHSEIWRNTTVLKLTENMRVKQRMLQNPNDSSAADFEYFLRQIGDGTFPVLDEIGENVIQLPDNIMTPADKLSDFIDEIYPDLERNSNSHQYMAERALLCAKNETVDEINNLILSNFPGDERIFYSADAVSDEDDPALYPPDFLASINVSGLPQSVIKIKQGCIIQLLRNLDPRNGACNGTRLIVHKIYNNLIDGIIVGGKHSGNHILIPRVKLCPSDNIFPFTMTRRQFPIRVAFAMTINKSQGQSLKKVGVYLPHSVFNHGQLYVAFSRVGCVDDLSVMVVEDGSGTHGKIPGTDKFMTKNIVYKEILS